MIEATFHRHKMSFSLGCVSLPALAFTNFAMITSCRMSFSQVLGGGKWTDCPLASCAACFVARPVQAGLQRSWPSCPRNPPTLFYQTWNPARPWPLTWEPRVCAPGWAEVYRRQVQQEGVSPNAVEKAAGSCTSRREPSFSILKGSWMAPRSFSLTPVVATKWDACTSAAPRPQGEEGSRINITERSWYIVDDFTVHVKAKKTFNVS